MTRRLDIELTSARDDGSWTWRVAGALKPRGVIDSKLLEETAKVGDVLRVEAQVELEGITVVSVVPSRERVEPKDRIEIAPRTSEGAGTVTTSLVGRRGRDAAGGPPRGEERERRPRGTATARPRREAAPRRDAAPTERPERRPPRPARSAPRSGAEAGPSTGRQPRNTPRRERETPGEGRPAATRERRPHTRTERFAHGTAHRDEYFATLPAEQRVIAEQLAIGGLPAVRKKIAETRATATASGLHDPGGEAVVGLAEQLLPHVRAAVWLDRAEAAASQLETISARDLRATVVGASPRDDHGRELLRSLREALQQRADKAKTDWEADVTRSLGEGRVLHALRLSSRPPDPSARLSAALVQPLAEAAGSALSATTSGDRWLALLEAAAASPVRRAVQPAGIPEDPSGAARQAAAVAAGRIPALARLLGLKMPPPPRPIAPRKAKPEPVTKDEPPLPLNGTGQDASVPEVAPEAGATDDAGSATSVEDPVGDEPAGETVGELERPNLAQRDEGGVEGIVSATEGASIDATAPAEVEDDEAPVGDREPGRPDELSEVER